MHQLTEHASTDRAIGTGFIGDIAQTTDCELKRYTPSMCGARSTKTVFATVFTAVQFPLIAYKAEELSYDP
jgi:hypothetical protein